MVYVRNYEMEFLEINEQSMAVFDADSGNVHYLNSIGKSILSCLKEPMGFDELTAVLCERYDGSYDEITNDLQMFLSELVEKRVLVVR